MPKQLNMSKERQCCVCRDATQSNVRGWKEGQKTILGLNITIYRKTASGRQLKTSRKVTVCEKCFMEAISAGLDSLEGKKLAASLFNVSGDVYGFMIEGSN